jgi:hypothetical protein
MRKLSVASLAFVLLTGCGSNPLGRNCQVDNDCGPGFDCYPDVCVQVCTKADECPQGQTCYRYHCIVPGQEHASRARPPAPPSAPASIPPLALPPTRAVSTPPLPDTTATELRAIRRELEILAAEQAKLTAAVLELKRSTTRPEKAAVPAREPAKKP